MSEQALSPLVKSKTTLCFLLRDTQILLAKKKRGFGEGKWNGTGGKSEGDETIEETAIRETNEEIGVMPLQLERVGTLFFYFTTEVDKLGKAEETAVFFARKWEGEPHETEEMKPEWFEIAQLPYSEMWDDDKYWVPLVLSGKKITGEFWFDIKFNLIKHVISEVE